MRVFKGVLLAFAVVATASAQSPEPPIAETRLTVHTLLREDIFAGFFDNNIGARGAGGTEHRAAAGAASHREAATCWRGRAGSACSARCRAHEAGNADGVREALQRRARGFRGRAKETSGSDGVAAIIGGSYAFFGDRLPQEHRAAAWAQAYDSYVAAVEAAGRAGREDAAALQGRAAVRDGAVGAADRPRRRIGAVRRPDADDAAEHAVRKDGPAVEGRSGERGDHQPDLQELPRPRPPVGEDSGAGHK